jgi:hypothetical protein
LAISSVQCAGPAVEPARAIDSCSIASARSAIAGERRFAIAAERVDGATEEATPGRFTPPGDRGVATRRVGEIIGQRICVPPSMPSERVEHRLSWTIAA